MAKSKKNRNTIANINGVPWFLNDTNYEHFKTLSPIQQEAIKQTMLLQYLKSVYGE